jgi:hypothetical protein
MFLFLFKYIQNNFSNVINIFRMELWTKSQFANKFAHHLTFRLPLVLRIPQVQKNWFKDLHMDDSFVWRAS